MHQTHHVAARIEIILGLLEQGATQEYIGEPISQLEHSLQCADLALSAGATEQVTLAALLHDIGHLVDDKAPTMADLGAVDHEIIGEQWLLRHGVDPVVTHLVRHHVSAKRYFCYRYPTYYDRLSEASRGTLQFQGGAMDAAEAAAFELDPYFKEILQMRTFDERAKVLGVFPRRLDAYRPMLERHLTMSAGGFGDHHA